jgi:hypothetical protein
MASRPLERNHKHWRRRPVVEFTILVDFILLMLVVVQGTATNTQHMPQSKERRNRCSIEKTHYNNTLAGGSENIRNNAKCIQGA